MSKAKLKVLVVDDEPVIRALLEQILSTDGYQVATAKDGLDALLVAEQTLPDLILLDLQMPNMDGLETCRQLRQRPVLRHCRIVMLTGHDTRELFEESIVAGADDFVGKPISPAELQLRLRSMLQVRDMADQIARLESYIKSLKDSPAGV